jgi:hypothetical protein
MVGSQRGAERGVFLFMRMHVNTPVLKVTLGVISSPLDIEGFAITEG